MRTLARVDGYRLERAEIEKGQEIVVASSETKPVWLTITEASVAMRLGRNKVYQLVSDGVIPHRRLGRSIHIHRDVAENWTPDDLHIRNPMLQSLR